MRIGFAQINTTPGDLAGNSRKIIDAYKHLVSQGAELVLYPELAITGYPPRDLLFKETFVGDTEQCLADIASKTAHVPLIVGTVTINHHLTGRPFRNSAAVCQCGKIIQYAHKSLLPTYDIFDEDRYFEPADEPTLITLNDIRVAITICEDIWTAPPANTPLKPYPKDPLKQLAAQKPHIMLNLSASPWHFGKTLLRQRYVTTAARQLACPVVYLNSIGANDEIIFDGRSFAADCKGSIIHTLPAFEESLSVAKVPLPAENDDNKCHAAEKPLHVSPDELADTHAALTLGIRDYVHKTGFKKALVALSGGIDSAIVAELAVSALGSENVIGVSLPSAISSQHSKDDAHDLARNLGIRCETISIASIVTASDEALAPLFSGHPADTTEENIQARIRGNIMMALSNKFGALLLTTGNKSEVAVGYCTLYGDMCGALAPIADLYKTKVYALARWINREKEIIPASTIEKPPSAELRPDQKDQDSLPPYDQLDALLHAYVDQGISRRHLVDMGFPKEMVGDITRKVDINEYKRKQAAPALKVSPLSFGIGRRLPIVQHYDG